MQLGLFEFLKQVESIFKGKSTNFRIQKVTQNKITCSHIEISHENEFFRLIW